MTVKSKEIRTITIEGVNFTPDAEGTVVPTDKETSIKSNFFFKHYVDCESFTIVEEKKETTTRKTASKTAETKEK